MVKPKLIQKNYDPEDKSTQRVYQYASGLKLVHYLLPGMTEFSVSVVIRAGDYFEHQVGVPAGTAHLLEHVISDNPNHKLRTRDELEIYTTGNKRRPWLSVNASTSNKMVWYYGFTPAKGADRLLNYLTWELRDKSAKYADYIERDRTIVISELNRRPSDDKNAKLRAAQFISENKFPMQTNPVGGTAETVAKITADDLVKYYKSTYTADRTAIGVQSGELLTKDQWQLASKLAQELANKSDVKLEEPPDVAITSKFDFKHFTDEQAGNTHLAINYLFTDNRNKYVHEASSQMSFSMRFVMYLVNKILREELGLIYSVDRVDYRPLTSFYVTGLKLSFNTSDLEKILDILHDIFTTKLKDFAKSKRAQAWLNDAISGTIFPSQQRYNRYAVDNITGNLVAGFETFSNFKDYKKAFRGLKLENLLACAEHILETMPPKLWLESKTDGAEIIEQLQSSKLYEHWSNLPEQKAPNLAEFGQKFYNLV